MAGLQTTMLVGEGAKLDVHGCETVDMASSFGKVVDNFFYSLPMLDASRLATWKFSCSERCHEAVRASRSHLSRKFMLFGLFSRLWTVHCSHKKFQPNRTGHARCALGTRVRGESMKDTQSLWLFYASSKIVYMAPCEYLGDEKAFWSSFKTYCQPQSLDAISRLYPRWLFLSKQNNSLLVVSVCFLRAGAARVQLHRDGCHHYLDGHQRCQEQVCGQGRRHLQFSWS
jgi:hypothetical protein